MEDPDRQKLLSAGMEEFFGPDFNPQKAGWKHGLQPIGCDDDGKLRGEGEKCPLDFCRCGTAMQSLWEREVLLAKGRFKFPELNDGHCYRLLLGGMSHVGGGDGLRIYLNGNKIYERNKGVGKRQGGQPIECLINQAWWPEFNIGEVDISVIAFQGQWNGKTQQKPSKRANFSLWMQEMKTPPLE